MMNDFKINQTQPSFASLEITHVLKIICKLLRTFVCKESDLTQNFKKMFFFCYFSFSVFICSD